MAHGRIAVAQAYRDAAEALESGDFEGLECCGISLDELGHCQHRPGHPTRGNPAILNYPECYDEDGHLIE